LNRFSSDQYAVDDSLPFISNIFLAQTIGLLGTIVMRERERERERERWE